MSKWLWSFEQLNKICNFKKPDPEILTWAVNRLCWLYPEKAGDIVIKFLDSSDIELKNDAESFFKDHWEPRFLGQVEKIYEQCSAGDVETPALLLTKVGDPRFIELFTAKYGAGYKQDPTGYAISLIYLPTLKVEEEKVKDILRKALEDLKNDTPENSREVWNAVITANMDAGTSILELLESCAQHPHLESFFMDLLVITAEHCGQFFEIQDLEKAAAGDGESSGAQEKLPFLLDDMLTDMIELEDSEKKEFANRLRQSFEKGEYEKAVDELYGQVDSMLEKKKKEQGEDYFLKWRQGKGTIHRYLEVLSAFHRFIPTAPVPLKLATAAAAFYIFVDFLELESLIGFRVDEMTVDAAPDYFLADRFNVEGDEAALKILESAEQEEQKKIIDRFLTHLEDHPESSANERVVRFLCGTGDPVVIEPLLKVPGWKTGLWEIIVNALFKMGTLSAAMVAPILENENIDDHDRIKNILHLLLNLPTNETVNVLLQQWDRLFMVDKVSFLAAVRMLGDRRFLKPLKNEWREGELLEGKLFSFLCRLNGVRDAMLKKIEQNTRKHEKEMKKKLDAAGSEDYRSLLRSPLLVKLTCRRCRRHYHYRLSDITIIKDTMDFVINDVVICKNCGALDHYEYSKEVMAAVASLFLMISKIEDLEAEDLRESIITYGEILTNDGKKTTTNESVTYYLDKFKQDRENPENLIGLANALRMAKRTEDAEPLYRAVLQHDPKAVEAYIRLAQIAHDRGNLKKAYDYYWDAYEGMETGNYYLLDMDKEEFKFNLFAEFTDVATELDEGLPKEVLDWWDAMDESKLGPRLPR